MTSFHSLDLTSTPYNYSGAVGGSHLALKSHIMSVATPVAVATVHSAATARPGPTAVQGGFSDSSFTGESGSSCGIKAPGSFVIFPPLPPGAGRVNPPEIAQTLDLGSTLAMARPPQPRRLSRLVQSKPLPDIPRATSRERFRLQSPPSSWSINIRGLAKVIKWSKSTPNMAPSSTIPGPQQENMITLISDTNESSLKRRLSRFRPKSSRESSYTSDVNQRVPAPVLSPNAGGVFLVPHVPVVAQTEIPSDWGPPAAEEWPLPPPGMAFNMASSGHTVIGHSARFRHSIDSSQPSVRSPPLAEISIRKSVSEVGHGSIGFTGSQYSPAQSEESFCPQPDISPSELNHEIPRNFVLSDNADSPIYMAAPAAKAQNRFTDFKRALSFKRKQPKEYNVPLGTNIPNLPRQSLSVEIDRFLFKRQTSGIENQSTPQLRRRSTVAEGPRPETPKFMLGPDNSVTSIQSEYTPSTSPDSPRVASRRRLTKRRNTVSRSGNLPITLEVETPNSNEIADPISRFYYPPPSIVNPLALSPTVPMSGPPITAVEARIQFDTLTDIQLQPIEGPVVPPKLSSQAVPPGAMRAMRPTMLQRPSLERRASRRRWTLNIAAEDIDDNILKAELERLRLLGSPSGVNEHDSAWTMARQVLLSAREVILTERSYLNQLQRYVSQVGFMTFAPPLLLLHLPALISASQEFCNELQEDPSAWGVSTAFIRVEDLLERVFVGYCEVVGKIMISCQHAASKKEGSHSRPTSSSKSRHNSRASSPASSEFGFDQDVRRNQISAVPRSKSMPGKPLRWRMSLPVGSTSAEMPEPMPPASTTPSPLDQQGNSLANGRAKALTASDIAIAPPQRVTRYVLLYRDVLNNTPQTSPSRPLIQRALDGAMRIADNCDKAQGDLELMIKRKS